MSQGERFPRAARLRSTRDIRAAFREGRRVARGELELFARGSDAGRPRAAVVVPTHGRTIVERNRLRRRLRELLRREWLPGASEEGLAVDLVVRTRPGAYGLEFDALRRTLLEALGELTWPRGS
ncbi:MAG TPA: ribonuclease P protein component [Gemmatimonadota bacterium]|nr:ribonuclease P protein component [Gemmatimonadota bacterium]